MRKLVAGWASRVEAGDFVAVADDEGEHRARWVLARGRALAPLFRDPATGEPYTVLLQADSSWRTVAATVAAGLTGATLALVNRHSTAAEIGYAFDDIRPDAVLAEPGAWPEWGLAGLLGAGPDQAALDGWQLGHAAAAAGTRRWAGGCVIGLTSGSSGRPKGVVQTEESFRYAGRCTVDANELHPGDPIAAIVPLSSTAAYCFGVALALDLGGTLVTAGRWRPEEMLARFDTWRVRWVMCVPTMALQLGRAAAEHGAPAGLGSMTVGGGPMDAGTLRRAEQALDTRILRVFGMSECLGHTTPRLDDPPAIRLGRDGRPFPGTQVRGVDAGGVPVPDGQPGRAQVRGPSLFVGYARQGAVEPAELTADGFFATGDLVVRGADGTIGIAGREKDVIIRGGRNIDVVEVESAVASHPAVSQVCVVPLPDPELGERIAVLVVPEPGQRPGLADLLAHLRERGLAKTKWPEFAFLVRALPQTRVGKLARVEARELAAGLHAAVQTESTPGSAPC
jgi:acyl-CoA synthetase (AMP-forming)/AMP-acid ligase II